MDIYADCNATTPLADGVFDAMRPFLEDCYGNASSSYHRRGRLAAEGVHKARQQLAELLGATPEQVVCTSGGTESCFQAFFGAARAKTPSIFLYSAVEHPAVIESAALLASLYQVPAQRLPVDSRGALDEQHFDELLASHPGAFVSLMLANNETGILFPIAKLARRAKAQGAVVHCDATQAVGKLPINLAELGVDLLSLSAHKFGGPKGVGALLIAEPSCWQPVMSGGGQEAGRRGGTEAVAQLVGMGRAAAEKQATLPGAEQQLAAVRDCFEARLMEALPDVEIHGANTLRLPNTSSVYVPEVSALEVRGRLADRGIVVSTGSACAASHATASHVLQALGRTPIQCLSVFRVSFGTHHRVEDAEAVADELATLCREDRISRRQALADL